MKRKTKNIVGIIVIVVALIFLIITSVINAYKYYYTVDEALLKFSSVDGRGLKVAGTVVKGSVKYKDVGKGAVFTLKGDSKELLVDYTGGVPDTFVEGIPVVVEGQFTSDGKFKADSLLTKCASRYEEKLD